jgi:hypothetical protein
MYMHEVVMQQHSYELGLRLLFAAMYLLILSSMHCHCEVQSASLVANEAAYNQQQYKRKW